MDWITLSPEAVPNIIARRLSTLLARSEVAWFVSGGDNISRQTETIRILKNDANIGRLQVLLIDERYGPVGHRDSNWQQLDDAGFFINGPQFIAPYTENERTLEQAVDRYEKILKDVMRSGKLQFAQLGIGDDGHISGILPKSSATTDTDHFVYGYETESYHRVTTTFPFLSQIDEIALVVFGSDKWPQLNKLQQTIDNAEQPVQIVKTVKHVTIYTDNETLIHNV